MVVGGKPSPCVHPTPRENRNAVTGILGRWGMGPGTQAPGTLLGVTVPSSLPHPALWGWCWRHGWQSQAAAHCW